MRARARDPSEIFLSRQAQNRTLLWDILPTGVPEFRALSEAGGCLTIQVESSTRVGNIVLDEIIDQMRFGEVGSCLLNLSLASSRSLGSLSRVTYGTSPPCAISRTGMRLGATGQALARRGRRSCRRQAHSEGRRAHCRRAPEYQARGDGDEIAPQRARSRASRGKRRRSCGCSRGARARCRSGRRAHQREERAHRADCGRLQSAQALSDWRSALRARARARRARARGCARRRARHRLVPS